MDSRFDLYCSLHQIAFDSVRQHSERRPAAPPGDAGGPFGARRTPAEAQAALERLTALAAKDAPLRAIQKANTDPAVVMAQTFAKTPRVGSNGGTAAGLVGSYAEVAEGIRRFNEAGIETFMLQFQPFEAEMRRFAQEVIPLVRTRPAPDHQSVRSQAAEADA